MNFLGLVLLAGLAPAQICAPPSFGLRALTGSADVIVHGRVTASAVYEANGTVEVIEYLKGQPAAADLKIYQRSYLPLLALHLARYGAGTCLDQYAHLIPGDEALLFLRRTGGGAFTVIGNGQGYVRVQDGMVYAWSGALTVPSAYSREGAVRTIAGWVGRAREVCNLQSLISDPPSLRPFDAPPARLVPGSLHCRL